MKNTTTKYIKFSHFKIAIHVNTFKRKVKGINSNWHNALTSKCTVAGYEGWREIPAQWVISQTVCRTFKKKTLHTDRDVSDGAEICDISTNLTLQLDDEFKQYSPTKSRKYLNCGTFQFATEQLNRSLHSAVLSDLTPCRERINRRRHIKDVVDPEMWAMEKTQLNITQWWGQQIE